MRETEEKFRQIIRMLMDLSEDGREATALLIMNYEMLKQMCLEKRYTNEQREKMMTEAMAKKDSFRMMLVCFEHVIHGD